MRSSIPTIYVLSATLLLSACGSSKKTAKAPEKLTGNWQTQPIVIDGDSKDWPSPYPNYDSKGKVAYATSNDGTNLYISIETGDEVTQLKILKAGMTVSIDTSGGREPQFSINYPMQNENEILDLPQPSKNEKGAAHMEKQFARQVKKMLDQANQFTLEGFSKCNGGYQISQNIPCGIKIKASIDEYNELIWEAAIPLKSLYNIEALRSVDAGKPITVCVGIKGLKSPKAKTGGTDEQSGNIGTGGTGMTGMGGRGGRGAGGHGGGRTQVENPLDHLYNSTKTWKQFGLAVQP